MHMGIGKKRMTLPHHRPLPVMAYQLWVHLSALGKFSDLRIFSGPVGFRLGELLLGWELPFSCLLPQTGLQGKLRWLKVLS